MTRKIEETAIIKLATIAVFRRNSQICENLTFVRLKICANKGKQTIICLCCVTSYNVCISIGELFKSFPSFRTALAVVLQATSISIRIRAFLSEKMDEKTKKTLSSIPLLKTKAGPRDKDQWSTRLKEELHALIKVWGQFLWMWHKHCAIGYRTVLSILFTICSDLTVSFHVSFSLTASNVQYTQQNKANDNDWFRLESNKDGTKWFGKCWYIHELLKYEFDIEFEVSSRGEFRGFALSLHTSTELCNLPTPISLHPPDTCYLPDHRARDRTARTRR